MDAASISAGLQQYSAWVTMMWPYIKIFGICFLAMFFVLTFKYQKEGFASMFGKMRGLKKIVVVGNDGHLRTAWVNFVEDYKMFNDKKAYVLHRKGFYINEYGEKVWFYVQDFTEAVTFKPYKKVVYVDKKTGEYLKDEKGVYVTSLNLKQFLSKKYKKEIDLAAEFGDLVQPSQMDDVIRKAGKDWKALFPSNLGEEEPGFDSTLTADVINRHLEIESLGFLKKYWKTIVLFGIIAIVLLLLSALLSYQASKGVEATQKGVEFLAAKFNQTMAAVKA